MRGKSEKRREAEPDRASLALWAAALRAECDEVERLVDEGASGFYQGADGDTALTLSAYQGCQKCVKKLLPTSDALAKNEEGHSALAMAARMGNATCVEALLPASDAGSADALGRSALMLAVGSGCFECVELLMPASDALWVDAHGHDALMTAASMACARSVALLLPWSDASREDASDGMTALMFAAAAKSLDGVRLLLPASDVVARDKRGRSAWDWAMSPGGMGEDAAQAIKAAERAIVESQEIALAVPTKKGKAPSGARRMRM